jgi:hypothetical protein
MKTAVTQCLIGCFAVPVCLVTFATPLAAREEGAVAPAARVITQVTEWDYNVDGVPESVRITTTTYDRQKNLLSTTYEEHGILSYRSTSTNTYDQHRNLLTVEDEFDFNGDGTVDRLSIIKSTYDAQGRLLTQVIGSGDQFVPLLTNSYDKKGNLLKTEGRDLYPGASVGDRLVITNTYDQRGRLVFRLFELHSASGLRSNTTENSYDVHGNLLTQVIKGDIEVDARSFVPGTVRITRSYDQHGRIVTSLTDWEPDNRSGSRSSTTNTYDQHGNLLQSVSASTGAGTTYVLTLTNSYDPQGNLLTQVEEIDQGGDGVIEQFSTSTNTYDQHRQVLNNVYERGTAGAVRSATTTTNTYDRQGNLLTRVVETDYNMDGTPDQVETTTITYRVVASPGSGGR